MKGFAGAFSVFDVLRKALEDLFGRDSGPSRWSVICVVAKVPELVTQTAFLCHEAITPQGQNVAAASTCLSMTELGGVPLQQRGIWGQS